MATPADLLHHLHDLPRPRDFSRPPSNYTRKNDARLSEVAYARITTSRLADKIMCLLPVLETRLGTRYAQDIADAFALQQNFPIESRIDLRPFSLLLFPFLEPPDRKNWNSIWKSAPSVWLSCQDAPLVPPHDPHPHRCRGPTKDTPRLGTRHDIPSPFLVIHFCWTFLDQRDKVAIINTHRLLREYAQLRHSASTRSIASLRLPRPPQKEVTPLCHRRAWLMGCALIRFNFVYADLIRWLRSEYTNDHRDWSSVFQLADEIAKIPVPDGNPPIDIERAVHISTSGAPLAGLFECSFKDVERREAYDNHAPLKEVSEAVRKKFIKEESLSYQIALPRFLWAYIYGLFISPITFVVRRPGEEGRICPDPSNKIHDHDTGAANTHIPDAGTPGAVDENPSVFYGSAFTRLLIWIYNLRVARSDSDILAHVDDISAAYHRVLYHPMMGIVFAQVFAEFLMIPVGLIFGAKDSPSWYMIPAELRSHIASAGDFHATATDLAKDIELPPPLTPRQEARLVKAQLDSRNTGRMHTDLQFRHSSFVDDTATAAWPGKIRQAINQSVLSAYVVFGFPEENRRPPPLNPDKWEKSASAVFKYLGFIIDTRNMTVIWPIEKRTQLADQLDNTWLNHEVATVNPKQASQLLGLIRHGALVCPLGIYLSLRLQFELNDFLSGTSSKKKSWWVRFRFRISLSIKAELRLLRATLDTNLYHPTWCRLIGLIIPRDVNTVPISDASYEGLGGLCRAIPFIWRLSANDLRECGWKISGDGRVQEADFTPRNDDDEAHINILEFLAIVINMWLLLKLLSNREGQEKQKHVIARFLADNTSALSWLSHASRTKRPRVRNLARLLTSLLLSRDLPIQVSGMHIPGETNRDTDRLSRFSEHPSWVSLMRDASLNYQNLPAYRVPRKLLTIAWSAVSNSQIADTSEQVTTALWRLELKPLPTGWRDSVSMTSL